MKSPLAESHLEATTLDWLEWLQIPGQHGSLIEPEAPLAERDGFSQGYLPKRVRGALRKLNPDTPVDALDEAFRKVTRAAFPSLVANNRALHKMLVEGVDVEYRRPDGSIAGDKAKLIDFDDPDQNDWLAVNQFAMVEGRNGRRPDVVIFLNGLPLVVIELKNPADEDADIWSAFKQLQTYKAEIPALMMFNEVLIISDGLNARMGTLTADREWFMPWKTIEGDKVEPASAVQLEVLLKGVFDKRRFLDLVRHFIVFEDDGKGNVLKKVAGYHQFHAVNRAVESTVRAASPKGDKRSGVVWHTQGSGKSLTMAFFTGKIVLEPAMENPTIVVLTDRNDLDGQLFDTFSRCQDLLRQSPAQASSRDHLRELLRRSSGGVIFTTIQKFLPEEKGEKHPLLSDRRNIVVIADEAHRSQYEFGSHLVTPKEGAPYIGYGFARNMREALPGAAFIGFTGTPIELGDANTRAVFGDYISIYDIQQAVEDGATVHVYYEGRLAKLELKPEERPRIDPDFDEATEGEEVERKEKLKTKWAALEAVVGAKDRVLLIAKDLVDHFESRLSAMDGKALVVCMSRRICMDLHDQILKLRPQWLNADDDKGAIKVIMTGNAAEGPRIAEHARNKARREAIAKRFKNPNDPLKIVIVRDMWLTGFDAPCLHTMYVDKPMQGHGLMQAIARVNRVFRDKPGGLVVDYLGLADQLRKAMANYTGSGGEGRPEIDQREAVAAMMEKYEVCCGILHGFEWKTWRTGEPMDRIRMLGPAQEHVLAQSNGKERFIGIVTQLSQAFALSVPQPEALAIQDEVGFFQAVRAALVKSDPDEKRSQEDMEHAIRQIVSRAVASDQVIDIFAAAGLKKPDISILSDEFLAEVKGLPQRNLAVELLRKLLLGDIRLRARRNAVQSRSFAEMLDKSIRAYQNRAVETAQIIEELIGLAREMRGADARGEKLGLTDDELAFYDALGVNDSAVKVLGDENLRVIARELVETVKKNVSIDWAVRESVRAKLRVVVKRILRKHGYPPDKQEKATQTVLEQAELIGKEWAA